VEKLPSEAQPDSAHDGSVGESQYQDQAQQIRDGHATAACALADTWLRLISMNSAAGCIESNPKTIMDSSLLFSYPLNRGGRAVAAVLRGAPP
jgi:hypothetical protein